MTAPALRTTVAKWLLALGARCLPPYEKAESRCGICQGPLSARNNDTQHRWTVCARPACRAAAKAIDRARSPQR